MKKLRLERLRFSNFLNGSLSKLRAPKVIFLKTMDCSALCLDTYPKHDLSMTTPVEAEIEPGKMRFFVGEKDAAKKRPNTGKVEVINLDPITVVAIGIRGSYNSENFQKHEKLLLEWIDE